LVYREAHMPVVQLKVSLGRIVLRRYGASGGVFGASDELMLATSLEIEQPLAVRCSHFTFLRWVGLPLC
jgi:hypothetical protein